MKNCPKCNAQLADDVMFCSNCGAKAEAAANDGFQPAKQASSCDTKKIYSILSYIGILWLIGLLVNPEKYDSRVRFNVGQGMILTILEVALSIVYAILSAIVNAIFSVNILGFSFPSPTADAINGILSLIVGAISLFYAIYGIVKVVQDKDAELPIIGKFVFYK